MGGQLHRQHDTGERRATGARTAATVPVVAHRSQHADHGLRVSPDHVSGHEQEDNVSAQNLQRRECGAEQPRRRYDRVEPENRLVAGELRRCWDEALAEVQPRLIRVWRN